MMPCEDLEKVEEDISDNMMPGGEVEKVEKKGNPQVQPRKDIDVY